jgi:hypothetical protein
LGISRWTGFNHDRLQIDEIRKRMKSPAGKEFMKPKAHPTPPPKDNSYGY